MHRPTTIATATATIALIAGAAWAGAGPSDRVDLAAAASPSSSVIDDDPSASDLLEGLPTTSDSGVVPVAPAATPSPSGSSSSLSPVATPSDDPTPGDDAPLAGEVVATRDAAGAGSVTIVASGLTVRLADADAAAGWSAYVERASGREVEVSFRGPAGRVDVHAEVDDGRLRIRVRDRRTGVRTEEHVDDGVGPVVRDEGDVGADSSGPGSASDDDFDDHDDSDDTSSVDSDDTSSVDSDDTSSVD